MLTISLYPGGNEELLGEFLEELRGPLGLWNFLHTPEGREAAEELAVCGEDPFSQDQLSYTATWIA